MIPAWMPNGDLPPGVYTAFWRDLEERFAFNSRRQRLLQGFDRACEVLRRAGCKLVYLVGSFVTSKDYPADYDACWDTRNVQDALLDPVFWDFSFGRAAQKRKFLGEFFPALLPEGATGRAFLEFFQMNRVTGERKGILEIRLMRGRRK